MILITQEEKDAVQKRYPNIYIIRTMKQKSKRHRYYMEEAIGAMQMIRRMRYGASEPAQKGRGRYHTGKNGRRNAAGLSQANRVRKTGR